MSLELLQPTWERVGKYEVKHYQVNDALDTAIKTYFGMKHSLAS